MTMGKLFDKLLNRKKERHPRCAALVPAAGRSERMRPATAASCWRCMTARGR